MNIKAHIGTGKRNPMPPAAPFSLVELLIVIAILAILLAMLMPSLARARYLAQRAACMGQVREMGAATLLYGADYNRLLPLDGRNNDGPAFIPDLVRHSVKTALALPSAVYACPGQSKWRVWDDTQNIHGDPGRNDLRPNYLYVGNGHRTSASWERQWRRRPQKLTDDDPTTRVIWSDQVKYHRNMGTYLINRPPFGQDQAAGKVEGANQFFLDGHTAFTTSFPDTLITVGTASNHRASHAIADSDYGHWWW